MSKTTSTKPVAEIAKPETKELATLDPDFFGAITDVPDDASDLGTDQPQDFVRVPYFGFRGKEVKNEKTKELLDRAQVEANSFYLFDVEPLKIKPFQVHLLRYKRYWTEVDDKLNVITSYVDRPPKGVKAQDHLVVLCLVAAPGGLVPALATLRVAMPAAFRDAIQLAKPGGAAADASVWASRSNEHKLAAAAKYPGGRFRITLWGFTDKSTAGRDYPVGRGSISPTPVDGVLAFNKAMDPNGDFYKSKVIPALKAFQKRCEKIEEKLAH